MSRIPDRYASSSKKTCRGKKKRFERHRFRLPNDHSRLRAATERNLNGFYSSQIPIGNGINELGVGDCRSEITDDFISDNNKLEGSSSTEEEFFDADNEEDDGHVERNCFHKIEIKVKADGSLSVTVIRPNDKVTLDIWKGDVERYGLDILLNGRQEALPLLGIYSGQTPLYGSPKDDRYSGYCSPMKAKVHNEAQTSVILGAEEISETEEVSTLSTKIKDATINSVEGEIPSKEFSQLSDVDFTLNSIEVNQYTANSTDSKSAVSDGSVNEEDKSKPRTDFTVPSLPMDNLTTDYINTTGDYLVICEGAADVTSSASCFMPLVKSMSDSLIFMAERKSVMQDRAPIDVRKESSAYPTLVTIDPCGVRGAPLCKTINAAEEWLEDGEEEEYFQEEYSIEHTENDSFQTQCQEFLVEDEEQLRPMTSAADAVKSMRQALQPINDQINDIKTKMIGMNIQPRNSSRHKFTISPNKIANSEQPLSIKRWLLTDPIEFGDDLTRKSDFMRNYSFPRSIVVPKPSHGETLIIFPGEFEDATSLSCGNCSGMSSTRSSMITEPEDIYDCQKPRNVKRRF